MEEEAVPGEINDDEQRPQNPQEEEEARPIIAAARAGPPPHLCLMGKHRMAAAIAQLHQQIQIIQEELDQLETLGESSLVCKEVVSSVEAVPDALLPLTRGPAEVGWDRWFQGAQALRSRKRWI